jgi:aryl carrier-like protein
MVSFKIIVPQHELNKEYVQKYLVSKIAEHTNAKQEKIDVNEDVRIYGFDSIRQMQLIRDLEDK